MAGAGIFGGDHVMAEAEIFGGDHVMAEAGIFGRPWRRSDYLMSKFCSWSSDVIMGQDLSCIWDAVQAVSLNRFIVFKVWMWFLNKVYNDWAFTLRWGISRIIRIDPWCYVWALVEDCWIPPMFLHTAVGPFRWSGADSGQGMFYLPS